VRRGVLQLTAAALSVHRTWRRDPISGGANNVNQLPLRIPFSGPIEKNAHPLTGQNTREKDRQRSIVGKPFTSMNEFFDSEQPVVARLQRFAHPGSVTESDNTKEKGDSPSGFGTDFDA
jgi:hypothetical protein